MSAAWESAVSSSNPVLWLKFDSSGVPVNYGSGGSTVSLGNGTGATTGVTAPNNYGYTFNTADNSRYDISSLPANTLSDKTYTIEAVVRVLPGTTNSYQTIWRSDNGSNSIILRVQGTNGGQAGKLEVYLCGNSGTGINYYSLNRIDDGQFHHIVLLAYSTNWELYVDGFQHASGAYPAGTLNLDTAGTRYISNAPGEVSNNMTIDEFAIYNFSFNLTDIYNHCKALFPGRAEIAKIGGHVTTRPLVAIYANETVNNTIAYNQGSTGGATPTLTTSGNLNKTASGGPSSTTYGYWGSVPSGWNTGFAGGAQNNYSYAFWVKRASAPASQTGFAFGNYFYDSTIYADNTTSYFNTNGTLRIGIVSNGTNVGATTATSVCDNTWHHIVWVKNATAQTFKIYVDGQLSATTNSSAAQYNVPNTTWYLPYSSGGTVLFDEFYHYPAALTDAQISALYTAEKGAVDVTISSPGTMNVTTSTLPDPITAAQKQVNYSHTVSTASSDIVNPAVSTTKNINLNAFGVATSSALMVDPTVDVTRNINYSHTVSTATALMTTAVIATQKYVNYSAAPATSSALLSSNVFFGQTNIDDTYNLVMRKISQRFDYTEDLNLDASNSFVLGAIYDTTGTGPNGIYYRSSLAIKANGGMPAYNKLVKVKFNPTHVTATAQNLGPDNTFKVYVFTANPSTSFTTMTYANLPAKELLYTTRAVDDSGNPQYYLDLTPAFADSRAATYGIFIEFDESVYRPSGYTQQDSVTYTGSSLDNGKLLYILSSDIVNKNINAAVMTADGLFTAATVDTQKYVNVSPTPSTASGLAVQPGIGLSIGVNAMVATVSGIMVQPTFARTVQFPHEHAEAFGTLPLPTWFAQGTVTYSAAPATASGLFHMPQVNIGENNTADTMDASATFVNPALQLSRSVSAMVGTVSGLMVQPAITTQLLGRVNAAPMLASTNLQNPPQFVNLFSDRWYKKLYTQDLIPTTVTAPARAAAVLKRFEDVATNIIPPSIVTGSDSDTSKAMNINLPLGIGDQPVNQAPKLVAYLRWNQNQDTGINPFPTLETGYFDPKGRKAVRFKNIAFANSTTDTVYTQNQTFTAEFIIKTTKANQVISMGAKSSSTSGGTSTSAMGLVDGKIYLGQSYKDPYTNTPHPAITPSSQWMSYTVGRTNIADGEWHHILIQGTQDDIYQNSLQIWVDGVLDRQRHGVNFASMHIIGHNSNTVYGSDFLLSGYSNKMNYFINPSQQVENYAAYLDYDPIKAEVMTASAVAPEQSKAEGNRPRALLLYFWPTSSIQLTNEITKKFDSSTQSGDYFDEFTFDNRLETVDFVSSPPQTYYGWDVFPVDVNGYYVSDLVKESAYGPENIETTTFSSFGGGSPLYKRNRRGYFRDPVTDNRRYLDILNDIDLSKFDAIFFQNYPDTPVEINFYAKDDIVDPYFNIRETQIFTDFLASLRKAVDTGVSLYVTNSQLAIDLGIVDRVEAVSDMDGIDVLDPVSKRITWNGQSDPYGESIATGTYPKGDSAYWRDMHKNNRLRIVNTLTGLTDDAGYIWEDKAFYQADDAVSGFGAPDRSYAKYTFKDALAVGDTFIVSDFLTKAGGIQYLATPFANVKAGTIVTAFATQVRNGMDLVDNPYKNYATSIALNPGDVLNGKQIAGKIFVNFTERLSPQTMGGRRHDAASDYGVMHLDSNIKINNAYNNGLITLAEKNTLLSDQGTNIDVRLAQGIITQSQYNKYAYWSYNGDYILTTSNYYQGQEVQQAAGIPGGAVNKTNKQGIKTTTATYSGASQTFSFAYSDRVKRITFEVPSMLTRGFRWLSKRNSDVGQVQRPVAATASAVLLQPTVVAEKEVILYTQAMVANARTLTPQGVLNTDLRIPVLPMLASAMINPYVTIIKPTVKTASALMKDPAVITTAIDEIILYVNHVDPILYLREDVIK